MEEGAQFLMRVRDLVRGLVEALDYQSPFPLPGESESTSIGSRWAREAISSRLNGRVYEAITARLQRRPCAISITPV